MHKLIVEMKEQLAEAGSRLYTGGLIAASDGNLSCRLPDGTFLVTRSGVAKGFLSPGDILHLDAAGAVMPEKHGALPRASIETELHLAIYRACPDVQAVVHAHPPFATAFALTGADLNADAPDEVRLQLGMVVTAAYAPAGTPALAENAAAAIRESGAAALLARHGAVSVGRSVEQALFRMEALEHAAKISAASRLLRR